MMKKIMEKGFKNLKKMELKKEGRNLLRHPAVKAAVMIVCIIVDAVSLFTLFGNSLNKNPLLLAAVVVAVSVLLVAFPVFLADYVSSPLIRKKTVTLAAFITCGTAFLILFMFTFVVRWYGRSILFDTSETDNYTTYYDSRSSADSSAMADMSSYENGVIILLGILPLINAALCFLLHLADKRKSRIDTLRLQQIDHRAKISEVQVAISLLQNELANHNLNSIEEEKYESARQRNLLITDYCKIVARRALAEKLKTPEATTLLLEENQLKEEILHLLSSDSSKQDQ